MSDFRSNLILKEIEIIQNKIDKYDKHSLIIKGWAITLWSASWIFIIEQRISNPAYNLEGIVLIIIFAILSFWFFDSLYKYYQRAFVVRTKQIEDYLNDYKLYRIFLGESEENTHIAENDAKSIILFNPVGDRSEDKFRRLQNLLRCFLLRNVSTLYSALIGISLLANSIFEMNIIFISLGITFLCVSLILLLFGYDIIFDKITNIFKKVGKKAPKSQ
ncbi:MAG: hypothetical protein V3V33_10135 [Candidatus Lokiarchaeia archaeon]